MTIVTQSAKLFLVVHCFLYHNGISYIYDPSDIQTNWIFLGDNNFDKGLNIIVLLSIIETFKSRNGDKVLRVVNLWRYG